MCAALCQHSTCAVLTELRNQDGVKVINYYAGLPPAKRQRYLPPDVPWSWELQTRPWL